METVDKRTQESDHARAVAQRSQVKTILGAMSQHNRRHTLVATQRSRESETTTASWMLLKLKRVLLTYYSTHILKI